MQLSKKLVSAAMLLAFAAPALANDSEFIKDTDSIGKTNGVIMSDQMLELGMVSSNALRIEGEQAMRLGNTDRAIQVLQRSVEMSPLDMDGRILYATALEKKLFRQKKHDRDPKLYNYLVKQWFFIHKKCEFPDQKMQAWQHLTQLTGTAPKLLEREKKYLSRVLIPEDGSVAVQIGKNRIVDR